MNNWQLFVTYLELQFGKTTLQKWLKGVEIEKYDARNIYLLASDSFQIAWLNEHLIPEAQKKLLNHQSLPYKVHIRLKAEKALIKKKSFQAQVNETYPLSKVSSDNSFENFVKSEKNLLTYQALLEFSNSLNRNSLHKMIHANPIYIYGKASSGKTHLLQALANKMRQSGLNPLYMTLNTFTEHFVKALQSADMKNFRSFYRSFDAMIVENIDSLSQKTATQEEFFHMFNTYHAAEKPIFLSSRLAQKYLEDIEPRLVSRFEWGLTLTLSPLGPNEIKAYLAQSIHHKKLNIPKDCYDYMVTHISSMSDLSQVLQMLEMKMKLAYETNSLITQDLVKGLLNKLRTQAKALYSETNVLEVTSKYFNISEKELLSSSKVKELVYPRRVGMYVMRAYGRIPFTRIGKFFNRDHSTIMTCVKDIEKKLASNDARATQDLSQIINLIKKKTQALA